MRFFLRRALTALVPAAVCLTSVAQAQFYTPAKVTTGPNSNSVLRSGAQPEQLHDRRGRRPRARRPPARTLPIRRPTVRPAGVGTAAATTSAIGATTRWSGWAATPTSRWAISPSRPVRPRAIWTAPASSAGSTPASPWRLANSRTSGRQLRRLRSEGPRHRVAQLVGTANVHYRGRLQAQRRVCRRSD